MELVRLRNLVDNDVELIGWGSEFTIKKVKTADGKGSKFVADREIGEMDVDGLANYMTFLEWQFKLGDDQIPSDSKPPKLGDIDDDDDSEVDIVYLTGDAAAKLSYDSEDSDSDDDGEEVEVQVIAVTDEYAQVIT